MTPDQVPILTSDRGTLPIDRRLGRGGMGVVYEAFDTQLKRQVAVKVIRPDLMTNPEAAARFHSAR